MKENSCHGVWQSTRCRRTELDEKKKGSGSGMQIAKQRVLCECLVVNDETTRLGLQCPVSTDY